MRSFWNPVIKGFHLMILWGFQYEFEKMPWHSYYNFSKKNLYGWMSGQKEGKNDQKFAEEWYMLSLIMQIISEVKRIFSWTKKQWKADKIVLLEDIYFCISTIDDLQCLHFSRMRTAWQTINNIFSIISGGQAGIVNVR